MGCPSALPGMCVELLIEAHLAHVQAMRALHEKAARMVSDGPSYVLLFFSPDLLPSMSYQVWALVLSPCQDQP
jgi:hypothetical protein